MVKEAVISDCGKYRYTLYRQWAEDPFEDVRVLNFCMLNPSTADGLQDDPTIRKCIGFAKLNGYNAIRVVNLFAWRATDPRNLHLALKSGENIVGPGNAAYIHELPPEETVVASWGSTFSDKDFRNDWVRTVVKLLNRPLKCLRRTESGQPGHPLYVPYGPLMNFDQIP